MLICSYSPIGLIFPCKKIRNLIVHSIGFVIFVYMIPLLQIRTPHFLKMKLISQAGPISKN